MTVKYAYIYISMKLQDFESCNLHVNVYVITTNYYVSRHTIKLTLQHMFIVY